MSPILTRPIREQLEHDRVIRQLQARYKRKYEVAINPGTEQNDSVSAGELTAYPDLVLYSQERGRRLEGTVEVETVESVTTLEAQFEWGMFSKLKAPFHLYVPAQALDTARRLCDELHLPVAEIWTYHVGLDQQVRFTQVYQSPEAVKAAARSAVQSKKAGPAAASAKTPGKPGAAAKSIPARPAVKAAKPAKATKPAKPAKPAKAAKAATAAKPAKGSSAKAAKPSARTTAGRSARKAVKAPPPKAAKRPAGKKRR